MFRNDLQHSGIYQTTPASDSIKLKWKFKTGGYVFSSPAVSGNIVFFGSNDSCFYAVDKASGSLVWKFRTGGVVSSSPAITDGAVYFLSFDGYIYALNALDGKEIWKFSGGEEKVFTAQGIHGIHPLDSLLPDPWDTYLSSPAVYKDKILFGSGSGQFFCLDKNAGKEIWSFQTGDVIHSAPAVYDGKVYFGGWDTYLHTLDIETGIEIWKSPTGKDTVYHNQTGIQSSPMIHDGILYFGCRDSHLYALDAVTGMLKWRYFNNFSWINNTPVVMDSIIYYGTSDTHKLIGLHAVTGDSIMAIDLNAYIFSSPVIAGNRLYIGDFSGTLYSVDYMNHKIIWEFRTDGASKDTLHILKESGELNMDSLMIYFKDGPTFRNNQKFMKALFSIGSVLSTPAVDNGVVFFGSSDGNLYAVE